LSQKCPAERELGDYVNGRLPTHKAGFVASHLKVCFDCQARINALVSQKAEPAATVAIVRASNRRIPESTTGTEIPAHLHNRIANISDESEWASVTSNMSQDTPTNVHMTPEQTNNISLDGHGKPIRWSIADTQMVDIRTPLHSFTKCIPEIPGYKVESEIGRGGMGVVYRGRHIRMNRPVAIKMVLAGGASDPKDVQRFLFEGEVLGRIQHSQVVDIYEVNMYQGPTGVAVPFLAMELLEGGTLSTWAEGKQLPPRDAAELVEGLSRAVHTAHQQGIIHRDLKPGNVLRSESGKFKVSDFGLAKFTSDKGADLTGTGMVVGTPSYMAPEQAVGAKQIGPAADVYSLGAVLYELLTGKPPFIGTEPMSVLLRVINETPSEIRALRKDVPRDLSAVVMKCLAKDPKRRYASAETLADDLRRFLDDRPTLARPLRPQDRALLCVKRNPMVSSLVASLFSVIIIGMIAVSNFWMRAERTADAERAAKDEARKAHLDALEKTESAENQRQLAYNRGAYLAFEQAVACCEQGRFDQGMQAFISALKLAESTDDKELQRVIRINIQNWDKVLFPPGKQYALDVTNDGRAMKFTRDGKRLVVVGREGQVGIFDPDTGEVTKRFRPARSSTLDSLLSFTLAVRGLASGDISPWQINEFTTSGQDLLDHATPPTFLSVAISQSGEQIAAGDSTGRVWLWKTNKRNIPVYWRVGANTSQQSHLVSAVGFGPDGDLWTAGSDGVTRRWNSETKQLKREFRHEAGQGQQPHTAPIRCMLLNGDGTGCIVGDNAGLITEWDTTNGTVARTWNVPGAVADLTFIHGEWDILACGEFDNLLSLNRANRGLGLPSEKLMSFGGANGTGIAPCIDARQFLIGDSDGNLRVWDTYVQAAIGAPLRVEGGLRGVRFRPGDKRELYWQFAVLSGNGVRMQSISWPPAVPLPPANAGQPIRAISFRFDRDEVLFCIGNRIRIYIAHLGVPIAPMPAGGYEVRETTLGMALDRRQERLYRGAQGGWSMLDFKTGKEGTWHPVPDTVVDSFAVHRDGSVFVKHDRKVEVWSADGEKFLRELDLDDVIPRGSKLSGIQLVSGSQELACIFGKRIEFVDSSTGRVTRPGIQTSDRITGSDCTPDGSRLATGHQDNTAQVWDVATGKSIFASPVRHDRAVSAVALSPEGTVLLTGCRDGTAQSWDVVTGLPIGPKKRHNAPVTAVQWNMLTATSDGIALVWSQETKPVVGNIEELTAKYGHLKNNSLDLR